MFLFFVSGMITVKKIEYFRNPHFTGRKRSCGKVMFPQVSVCTQQEGWEGIEEGYLYIKCIMDIKPGDLSPTSPNIRHGTYPSLLVTSGGGQWRPVQTCSLGDQPCPRVTSGGGHWNWKHVRFPSGRYASYWNPFLLHSAMMSSGDDFQSCAKLLKTVLVSNEFY